MSLKRGIVSVTLTLALMFMGLSTTGCGSSSSGGGGGGGGGTATGTVQSPDGSTATSLEANSPVSAVYTNLTANTKYTVNMVDPSGTTVCSTTTYANASGTIPSSQYCFLDERDSAIFATDGRVDTLIIDDAYKAIEGINDGESDETDEIMAVFSNPRHVSTGDYTLQVVDSAGDSVVSNTVPITSSAASACASNSSGLCARSFLKTNSNMYATIFEGTGITDGATVDIYVINDRCSVGYTGASYSDVTGGKDTVTVNYSGGKFTTSTPIWATPASTGIFDVVIDVNQDGAYDSGDVIEIMDQTPSNSANPDSLCAVGVTVQDAYSTDNDVIMQIAMDKNRAYQDIFNKDTDDIYAQVQSQQRLVHKFGVKKYIVEHKDTWTDGDILTDVIDPTLDVVQSGCTNQQRRLIGPIELLSAGCYDVVFDVDGDGVYDKGGDAVDNIDLDGATTCGFIVVGASSGVTITNIKDTDSNQVIESTSSSVSSKMDVTGTASSFTDSATVKGYFTNGTQTGGTVTGSISNGVFTINDVPALSGANVLRVYITEGAGTSSATYGADTANLTWNPGGSSGDIDFLAVINWTSLTDMDTHLVKMGGSFAGSSSSSNTGDCHYTNCAQDNNEALLWTSTAGSQTTSTDTSSGAIARLDLDCIGCASKTETTWVQDVSAVAPSGAGKMLLCIFAFSGEDTPTANVSINGVAQLSLTAPSSISRSDSSADTWFVGYVNRDASGNLSWNAINSVGGTSVCTAP